MIIDDETDIETYLLAALEDHGYLPCLRQGDEGVLEAVFREKPDLIVLDIMMPRKSGISIYAELRKHQESRHIPIALMSGLETSRDLMTPELIDMIDSEVIDPPDGFIEKPIRLADFLNLVSELIQSRRMHEGTDPFS